jgi:predicted Zn finger-like uncharacterized protein
MTLVTRCPACATTFKVVRDQLRISEGWVRCGRCSEVFDATLDLQEVDDDGNPVAPSSTAAPAPAPQTSRPPQENLLPASAGLPAMNWPAADLLNLGAKAAPPPAAAPAAAPTTPPATPPALFNPADDPVPIPSFDDDDDDDGPKEPWFDEMMASTEALQAALQSASISPELARTSVDVQRKEPGFTPSLTTPSPIEEAVNAQVQKALRRERLKVLRRERAEQKERERVEQGAGRDSVPPASSELASAAPAQADVPETLLLEAPSAPASFIDDAADAPPKSRSRLRTVLLAFACLLALVALLLQVARVERDTLLAREPRLRPALQTLCKLTDCELSALRQIGSITIDGASFSREKEGDGYRLVFTLRNAARVPLAMPSIELTLLDTQERALVRRVMLPAQFGAATVLAPGAEHNSSLPLQLAGSEAAGLSSVAGYRLLAFYP